MGRNLGSMSMPAPNLSAGSIAEFIERHETLRSIMEWIGQRFADADEADDTIEWEDGEEHDRPHGSATL
jgi:hypothetical protein